MNSMWSNIASRNNLAICEPLVTQVPNLPPRSWAYHLAPMNVGTSACESLTSYFIRLCESHSVTPRALFVRGLMGPNQSIDTGGLVTPNSSAGTRQINSNGLVAEKWVAMLEAITRRNDLRFLTFLPFQECVSKRDTSHPQRAWCPSCLEHQLSKNGTIYEHLLWTNKYVTVCPIHRLILQTKCPHCGMTSKVLQGSMRPGKCSKCNGWLGDLTDKSNASIAEPEDATSEYNIFAANQIGILISVAPSLRRDLSGSTAKIGLRNCVNQCFDGNVNSFAKYLGLSTGAVSHFGKKHLVSMKMILKIAYTARVGILDLLTNEDALKCFSARMSVNATKGVLSGRRNRKDVVALLRVATTEIPPPSISEVATRLGYSSSSALRPQSPDLCDLITVNFRNSQRGREARSVRRVRLKTDEVIEAALRAALKDQITPSLKQVAKSLGYRASVTLSLHSPKLCRALVEKRQKPLMNRRKCLKDELEKSLKGNPPEQLIAISKRLGYQTNSSLRSAHPELSRKIRIRYETYKRSLLLTKAKITLNVITAEIPPPSLNASLRRLSVSDGWLRKYFPREHRSISSRSLKFRREQSLSKKLKEKNRIRAIVRELHEKGLFPSMNAVIDVFTARALRHGEVWATIKAAREEL